MKNRIKWAFVLLTALSLYSCGKDRLVPRYKPMTVNQLTNNKPMKFTYQIDDIQIDKFSTSAEKFPIFGKLFQAIARSMANAKLGKNGMEIDLPHVTVDLSQLLKADLSTVELINLQQLDVSVRNPQSKDSLIFLDKIEIWVKLHKPIDGLPMDEEGFTRMLYYDRADKTLSCNEKCLVIKSEHVNWKKFLQDNPSLEIKPLIKINAVPDTAMKLAGSIEYSIKFNVGF